MTKIIYKSKKEIVVEAVREAIISGELKPGDRLLQDELAEFFNVSATPVREALRQLQAEGALDYSQNKGVRVAEVTAKEIHEICLIRTALETLATRLAVPHLEEPDIKQLRVLNNQMGQYLEEGVLEKLRVPNYKFHFQIYEEAGMPLLQQIIRNLWSQFPWDTLHELPGRATVSFDQHEQIIQAIENQDAELASQRVKEHIKTAVSGILEYLSNCQQSDT